jgi:hypothetical protein
MLAREHGPDLEAECSAMPARNSSRRRPRAIEGREQKLQAKPGAL